MKHIGVIPARIGSTRLGRKPLQTLLGKPLILWVCEAAQKSKLLNDIIVATDSKEVFHVVETAGFKVAMTPATCPSGTDRVFQVVKDLQPEIIVNIQGDEPLIEASEIDSLVRFIKEKQKELNLKNCWATLGNKLSLEDLNNKNAVKVIINAKDEALYFSRFPIPYSRKEFSGDSPFLLKHIGLYAYTFGALESFCKAEPCDIEKAESLEQLRALHLGYKIFVKESNYISIGIDTKEDLVKVEKILKQNLN